MSRMVRLTGRFMNAEDETADIVCRVATASVPPPRRTVGAGGDVQTSISPTAIVLWDVEPASMVALRKGNWTHVHWSGVTGESDREMQVRQISIEGKHVRVLV